MHLGNNSMCWSFDRGDRHRIRRSDVARLRGHCMEEESANKFASAAFSSGSEGLQKIVLSMLWLWRGRRVWYLRLLHIAHGVVVAPPTNQPTPSRIFAI